MIGRRKRPDGLPFRLYAHYGKHKVSFGYKLPNGRWAFRLSAPAHNKEALAEIRKQAIERAEALNGDAVEPGTLEALAEFYFDWQEGLPASAVRRRSHSTRTAARRSSSSQCSANCRRSPSNRSTSTATSTSARRWAHPRKRTRKSPSSPRSSSSAGAAANWKRTRAAASSTTRRSRASVT